MPGVLKYGDKHDDEREIGGLIIEKIGSWNGALTAGEGGGGGRLEGAVLVKL